MTIKMVIYLCIENEYYGSVKVFIEKSSKLSDQPVRLLKPIYWLFFLSCSSIVSNFFFCSAGTNLGQARNALPTNLNCDDAINCFSSRGVFNSAALPPCFWKTVNTSAAILTRTAFTNSTSSDLASQKVITDIEEYVNNSLLVTGNAALDCATADGANATPRRKTDAWREAAVSQENAFEFNWLIDLFQSSPIPLIEGWTMVQVDEPDIERESGNDLLIKGELCWTETIPMTHSTRNELFLINNLPEKR